MRLVIPDSIVAQTGLSDRQFTTEVACWLFDTERLHLWPAAQVAGMKRAEFEQELRTRGVAIYRPTVDDVVNDLRVIEEARAASKRTG